MVPKISLLTVKLNSWTILSTDNNVVPKIVLLTVRLYRWTIWSTDKGAARPRVNTARGVRTSSSEPSALVCFGVPFESLVVVLGS